MMVFNIMIVMIVVLSGRNIFKINKILFINFLRFDKVVVMLSGLIFIDLNYCLVFLILYLLN